MNRYRADIVVFLLVIFFFTGFLSGKYQKELNDFLIEIITK